MLHIRRRDDVLCFIVLYCFFLSSIWSSSIRTFFSFCLLFGFSFISVWRVSNCVFSAGGSVDFYYRLGPLLGRRSNVWWHSTLQHCVRSRHNKHFVCIWIRFMNVFEYKRWSHVIRYSVLLHCFIVLFCDLQLIFNSYSYSLMITLFVFAHCSDSEFDLALLSELNNSIFFHLNMLLLFQFCQFDITFI